MAIDTPCIIQVKFGSFGMIIIWGMYAETQFLTLASLEP
jgi:hypothetical protein